MKMPVGLSVMRDSAKVLETTIAPDRLQSTFRRSPRVSISCASLSPTLPLLKR